MEAKSLQSKARQQMRGWMVVVMVCLAWSVSHCQCVNILPNDEKEAAAAEGAIEKSEVMGDAAPQEQVAEAIVEKREPSVESSPEQEPNPPEKTPEAQPEESTPEAQEKTPEGTTSKIGDPCKSDADCGGMPLRCLKEDELPSFPFPSDSGSGPPGGYCTAGCYIGGEACPPDAVCYVPGAASGACLKSCKEDKDCRAGYQCRMADGNDAGCMPPPCALTEPKGTYKAIVRSSRVISGGASCAGTAIAPGTSLGLSVSINAGQIKLEFGSKPNSPLPVTWPLEGKWNGLNQSFTANSRNQDGLVKGAFMNACLFYGQLEVESGTCRIEYETTIWLP